MRDRRDLPTAVRGGHKDVALCGVRAGPGIETKILSVWRKCLGAHEAGPPFHLAQDARRAIQHRDQLEVVCLVPALDLSDYRFSIGRPRCRHQPYDFIGTVKCPRLWGAIPSQVDETDLV